MRAPDKNETWSNETLNVLSNYNVRLFFRKLYRTGEKNLETCLGQTNANEYLFDVIKKTWLISFCRENYCIVLPSQYYCTKMNVLKSDKFLGFTWYIYLQESLATILQEITIQLFYHYHYDLIKNTKKLYLYDILYTPSISCFKWKIKLQYELLSSLHFFGRDVWKRQSNVVVIPYEFYAREEISCLL